MDHSLLPIPPVKINAVLWHGALLCLRHGTRSGSQAGGEPMALPKWVPSSMEVSCSLRQTQQAWKSAEEHTSGEGQEINIEPFK